MANLGTNLVSIYQSYEVSGSLPAAAVGGDTAQLASKYPAIEFNNGLVGIQLSSLGGDFGSFTSQLTSLGVQITNSSAYYGMVDGWAPIGELPTIARLPQTMSGEALQYPIAYSEYQGAAYNEAETSLMADAARGLHGATGAGVTVGVLSSSVSQYDGGLPESYATGDLDPNNQVKVIQDAPPDEPYDDDEGRAMLENIHDIAPGANLQFATGVPNELNFQQNIEALASKGSKIIVQRPRLSG